MNVEIRNRRGTGHRRGRALRWSATAAALTVAPKCGMCVFAYFALATGAQIEICGTAPQRMGVTQLLAPVLAVGAIGTSSAVPPLPRPASGFPR